MPAGKKRKEGKMRELTFEDFWKSVKDWFIGMTLVAIVIGVILGLVADYVYVRTPRYDSDLLSVLGGKEPKYYPQETKEAAKVIRSFLPESLDIKETEKILKTLPKLSLSQALSGSGMEAKKALMRIILAARSLPDKNNLEFLESLLELDTLDDEAPGFGIYVMCRDPEMRVAMVKAIRKELPESALPQPWNRGKLAVGLGLISWVLITFPSFMSYLYNERRGWGYKVPWNKLGTYLVILIWLPGVIPMVIVGGVYKSILAIGRIDLSFLGWQKAKKGKGLFGLLKRFGWHSFLARTMIAKIALSEREKGMFSEEIGKIQQAVFPLDIILSLFYLRKTKRALKIWELNSQEKEDIKYIYQEIRKLVGKLIPQGSEESLMVITALRKKASQITNAYLKKNIDYQQTRDSLLATLDELVTVGDILEARKPENQITYYSLLGIRPRAETEEIKKAYRSVIAAIHPDRHQGNPYLETLAAIVNVAYDTLNNPIRKTMQF